MCAALANGLGGAAGFGADQLVSANDSSTPAISLSGVFAGGFRLFSQTFQSMYINSNGNLTFTSPLSGYAPSAIGAGYDSVILAPFWAEVDMRAGASAATGGNTTGSDSVWYSLDAIHKTVTVTWYDVGSFDMAKSKTDTFQVQLVANVDGSEDIRFLYQNVQWTTGSGGVDGLGGPPARIGYSSGAGDMYELPGSGAQAALLALPTTLGNTGQAGIWEFHVSATGVISNYTPVFTPASGPVDVIGTAPVVLGTVTPGFGTDPLTASLVSDSMIPSGSTVTLVGSNVVYTPGAADVSGTSTVVFKIADAVTGAETTEAREVTFPYAPMVKLTGQATASNELQAVLSASVASFGGDPLTVALVADAYFERGSSVALVDDTVVYAPGFITAAQMGVDTIHYTVTDAFTGMVTDEIQNVVLSNGPAPVVVLATVPVASNEVDAVLGDATAGFGGHPLAAALISDASFPTGSNVSLSAGRIVYKPGVVTSAKVGQDTIQYTVTDAVTGAVTTETQIVTLRNDPAPVVTLAPAPTADNITTATLGTVVAGIAGDALSVTLTADADYVTGSSLSLVDGRLVYTPGLVTIAQVGADVIHYTVTDTVTGATTLETQTVTLSNGPAPVVTLAASPFADCATTAALGTAVAGLAGDALSVTLTADADFTTGSSISLVDGHLVYTPGPITAAQVGSDVIRYRVTDTVTGAVTVETQTVMLGRGAAPVVTLAPAPTADNITTATLGTVVAGIAGDALSVTLTADADYVTGSSLSLVDGRLVYTPGLVTIAQVGADVIHYTVTDTVTGAATLETQTVTLSNGPAPVVTLAASPFADCATTAALGTAVAGLAGDALSVTLTADADFTTGSSISLVDGHLVYTPGPITAAQVGSDVIRYRVTDTVTGAVTVETQTVMLGRGAAPVVTLAPAPTADNITTATLGTVVAGIAGDALSVTLTADADYVTGSSLSLVDGRLVYTPGLVTIAQVGADVIHYTVTDTVTGATTLETQTVTLSNGPAPVVTLAADPTADKLDVAVLGSAVAGVPGHALSVTLTGDTTFATGSSLALSAGHLVYTPGAVTIANIGPDTLHYIVTDTVTGAVTLETQVVDLTLMNVAATTIVYLYGKNNVVDAPTARDLSTGNAGALITDPIAWSTNTVILGTPNSETIKISGYGNTIISNGGNDTIDASAAGTSNDHIVVSDANGDNTVSGFVDTTSVMLGNGNNAISLGGYGNYIHLGNGNNTVSAGSHDETVVLGNGNNTVMAAGASNIITLGTGHNTVDAGEGYATINIAGGTNVVTVRGNYHVFNIAGGTTSLGGFARYATINVGGNFAVTDSIDLLGAAGDVFTFANGVMHVALPDGEVVATVNTPGGKVMSAISDGADGMKLVLGLVTPPAPAVITETQVGVTLSLADATHTVHLFGVNNTVSGGNGDHVIDGDKGGLHLTLGNGNNVIAVLGLNDVIILGAGDNSISGTLSSATITTGAGNQTITTTGYSNTITTGAGNSVIHAGAGFEKVNVGSGTNTVVATGNGNTITTHLGENTVSLSGWNNLIQAGAGRTMVSGGYANTYEVTALGTAGGVEIADFSSAFGDVLNLHDVIGAGFVSVSDGLHGDLLVSVTPVGDSAVQVADLHGMAGISLKTLMDSHAVTI